MKAARNNRSRLYKKVRKLEESVDAIILCIPSGHYSFR